MKKCPFKEDGRHCQIQYDVLTKFYKECMGEDICPMMK